MSDILLSKIKSLMKEQKECESLDCYDDHGGYFDAGYYEGYIEALTTVLEIIENDSNIK